MMKAFIKQKRAYLSSVVQTKRIERDLRMYVLQNHVGLLVEFRKNSSTSLQYLASSGMDNCIGLVMWASLDENTNRGLLTHLDGSCTAFMRQYMQSFVEMFSDSVGKITTELVLPANPNKDLLKASRDVLATFQESIDSSEKKDETNFSTDFCLDLSSGMTFLYKESVLGISNKGSKLSLNHFHASTQILKFFELMNGNVIPKILPDRIELTPQQILCLSCMLGDVDRTQQILDVYPTLINECDVETGCTPLLYAIYTMVGEFKLENFISVTKADIVISSGRNPENAVKALFDLKSKDGWEIAIVQALLNAGADVKQEGNKEHKSSLQLLTIAIESLERNLLENPKSEKLQQNYELLETIKQMCELKPQQQASQSSR